MSYGVNNHLNNLYVLSNKAVGPGKNPKLINVGPTSILESRVCDDWLIKTALLGMHGRIWLLRNAMPAGQVR